MTDLIKQNDIAFKNTHISIYGCRFRCLLAMAELTVNKTLTQDNIKAIYERSILDPFIMNKECLCGNNEHKLIEYAFDALGYADGKGRQIATKTLATNENASWGGDKKTAFTILHIKTQFRTGHFVLGDSEGQEIFDPWNEKDIGNPYIKRQELLRILYYWIDRG